MLEFWLVLLAAGIWFRWPGIGWIPLIIAAPPLLLRIVLGDLNRRTAIYTGLATLFLLSALLSVAAAYNTALAWEKFWILLAGCLLFASLIRQPLTNIWLVAGTLSLVGGFIALNFLLTHDWLANPGDLGLINDLGSRLMSARPAWSGIAIHPNFSGGILAALSPVSLAVAGFGIQSHKPRWSIFGGLSTLIMLAALFLTSSRAAWMALFFALWIWFLWLVSQPLSRRFNLRHQLLFAIVLGSFLVIITGAGFVFREELLPFATRLPGASDSAVTRLELARNTLDLTASFPISGGGLRAFPGLYSRYIMLIPHYLFGYSHNFYLDVSLEQGIFGLVPLLLIYGSSVGTLIFMQVPREDPHSVQLLRWGVLAGLGIILLHGFLDDPLYGQLGTPFLFALPGLSLAVGLPHLSPVESTPKTAGALLRNKTLFRVGLILGGLILVIFAANWKFLMSTGFSNLGAINMSRLELGGWPEDGFSYEAEPELISAPEQQLREALRYNSDNVASNFRLGLIAMMKSDYPQAIQFLEISHRHNPHHRGIQKALAYNYVWVADFSQAEPLLRRLPEALQELNTYAWWWNNIGKPDLGGNAALMAARLMDQQPASGGESDAK